MLHTMHNIYNIIFCLYLIRNQQEQHVDAIINKQASAKLLQTAKQKAVETEKALMKQIMNISQLNNFLNNIIQIENLMNSFYSAKQRALQKQARQKCAPNITVYENKPKPVSDVASFVELMFVNILSTTICPNTVLKLF